MRILILSVIMVVGTALDVATTLYNVLLHGDRFMEANQFVQPEDIGFFFAVNALFMLVCLVPVWRTHHQSREVFSRLRQNTFVNWLGRTFGKDESSSPDATETHDTFVDLLRSPDGTVMLLLIACAGSLMRMSAGINNLMEVYLGQGFAGAIFSLFPFIPLSVSVHLLASLTVILCIPLGYIVVRWVALIGPLEDDKATS